MTDAIKALLGSRKFIVVTLAILTVAVLVALGKVQAGQFVQVVAGLAAVLTGSIAYEDKKPPPPAATP